MKCGLLGGKLGHSYSPQIHSHLGDYEYALFERAPEELEAFLNDTSIQGCNVTIPYKKAVIPYLQELSDRAKRLGAVNTIVRRKDGSLIGHNTDYYGFETMLKTSGVSVAGKKCLVLGSGGASATSVAVLEDYGAQVVVISRSGENNYGNLDRNADASLIVNATPVGMYPNTIASPLDISVFPRLEVVLDVVYNPARTGILLQAEKRGIVAVNGLLMLVSQAKESAEWFLGKQIDDAKIPEIYRILKAQMENIVLIGMPGSGKSTIGQILAEKTGKPLKDADEAFTEKYGKTPAEVINASGEKVFREMETAVLADLGKQSGLILATGGGCITIPENYDLLHQNGTIYYISRDLDKLPTANRPLSQQNGVKALFEVRKPLYEKFADHKIDNNGSAEAAADQILSLR